MRIPTKYFALIEIGKGIIMISFSAKRIPNAMRMAKIPPDAPTVALRIAQNVPECQRNRGDRCADHANKIQLEKPPRAPCVFECGAEHPQTDHVPEPV